ncbi:hypothetical protein SS50377_23911 [Spironucleus salmonicida]|uniref:Uncharacterized protein n=1 Tax=Spironucleus salmonicida TaxID=348837 RepID=A0A9P8LTM3_9EUKA|nr:hypothetical protein SS50377_23911 [Spironucleus salmonicida]
MDIQINMKIDKHQYIERLKREDIYYQTKFTEMKTKIQFLYSQILAIQKQQQQIINALKCNMFITQKFSIKLVADQSMFQQLTQTNFNFGQSTSLLEKPKPAKKSLWQFLRK